MSMLKKCKNEIVFLITYFLIFSRSFVPPVRDEEHEIQRKAHAKRVRETRRSTQVTRLLFQAGLRQWKINKSTDLDNKTSDLDNKTSLYLVLLLFVALSSSAFQTIILDKKCINYFHQVWGEDSPFSLIISHYIGRYRFRKIYLNI